MSTNNQVALLSTQETSGIIKSASGRITSIEVLDQINLFRNKEGNRKELRHDTLRSIIKDEFEAEVLSQNILEKSIPSRNGRPLAIFEMSLSQAKQILLRESKFVRRAVLLYIEQLEKSIKSFHIPKTLLEALYLASAQAKTIEEQDALLQLQAPKVLFAEAIENAEDYPLIAELAKILRQQGVKIGQNRLFEWLRKSGYLGCKGKYYNQPTQRAMDKELFRISKEAITLSNGKDKVVTTTSLTSKGTAYFVKKILSAPSVLSSLPELCE